MKPYSIFFGMFAAILVIALLLLVFGVRFTSDVMAYDPAKEIVATGTVESLHEFACPAGNGELGGHLMLKTSDGEYEVHLAPSRILRSVNWRFEPGQQIEVRGAKVRFRGKEGLLARQITRGTDMYTFRDGTGKLLISQ
jgi:hypothetical protein